MEIISQHEKKGRKVFDNVGNPVLKSRKHMIAVLETPGNSLKSSTKWYKTVGNQVEITCKHQEKVQNAVCTMRGKSW